MLVAVNLLIEDNKDVGVTVFDTFTNSVINAYIYSEIWGTNEKCEFTGYSYLPLFDCKAKRLVSDNAYTIVAKVREGLRINYIVADGLGKFCLLNKENVLELMKTNIFTNLAITNRKSIKALDGSLPTSEVDNKAEVIEGISSNTVDCIGDMQFFSASSTGTNKKSLGYRLKDRHIGVIKFPLINNSNDCINEVVCYKLGKLFGVNVAEASLERYDQKQCIISLFGYDYPNNRIRSLREIIGLDKFDKQFNIAWLKKNYPEAVDDFNRMIIFDLLTRQTDRKMTDISIYDGKLYNLYDNGRCLFFDEDINSINTLDVINTFCLNEHGLGYEYLERYVGADRCRNLINQDVTYNDIYHILNKYYEKREAEILSYYIIRVYKIILKLA